MAGANVVGVATVAGGEIEVVIGSEGDRAAVVIAGVFAEGYQLTAARGIYYVRIGRRHLPFANCVFIGCAGPVRRWVRRSRTDGNGLARVCIKSSEARAHRV